MIIPIENCGAIGVVRDAYAHELPLNAWSDSRNMRFREGYAEKFSGEASVYGTPTVAPYFVLPYYTGTSRYLIYAGLAKIYYADKDGVQTNITRQTASVDVNYTGTAADKWNGGVLSGIALANNGVDVPQYWTGTGKMTDMSGITGWASTTKCKVMRPFRNHILALNINKNGTLYPHMVKWSHPADPGTMTTSWDHTDATKDAGEQDLSEDQSQIVDGLTLGEQFIIYKENSFWSCQYIGPPYIFRFQKISSTIGALGVNCACPFPGGHLVLAPGDLYAHAGGEPQSVIDAKMRRWLLANLDVNNYARSFIAANPVTNEAWAYLFTSGETSAKVALVYNWKTGTSAIRDVPSVHHANFGIIDFTTGDTWAAASGTWATETVTWNSSAYAGSSPRLLMASGANTLIYLEGAGETFNGTNMSAYLWREKLSFGDPSGFKLMRSIRPLVEAAAGTQINVYVGSASDQASDTVWQGPFSFTVGTDQKIDCLVSGRFHGVRFESTGSNAWRLKRYDVDVLPQGLH